MAKVAVYNMEGKEVDSIELNDSIFGVEINEHLVHMAVLQQLANNRQGTQQDRDLHVLHSGQAAELYSLRYQEITHSSSTRKRRELH